VKNDNPSQESKDGANSFFAKIQELARNGDFNGIGKIVSQSDVEKNEVGAVLGRFCWEANTFQAVLEYGTTFKTAQVIIEALFQRKESVAMLKMGGFSWRGREKSPVSERCLQAALDLGPLDKLYAVSHDWLTGSSSSAEFQQKKSEFGALAIIRIAERGYRDSFFCAAGLLHDGDFCEANHSAARMYFYRFALGVTIDASISLELAGEAFAELVKLTDTKKRSLLNYYSTMSEVASKASKHLSPLVPGEEFEIILGLPEASKLEFKSTARWSIKEDKVNSDIEHEVVKTIAAFLNTDGGVLVIGVGPNADKEMIGLEQDYKSLTKDQNEDGFKRFLGTLIQNEIGIQFIPFVSWSVISFRGKEFCRVEARKSPELVFVRRKAQESLYVRVDNQTLRLTDPSKIEAWRKHRELASKSPH
jgi:hypothetical protein